MKKTVIIAIFLVYLASIVAVNFFGLKMVMFEADQEVTSIVVNGIIVERDDQTEVEDLVDSTGKHMGYKFKFITQENGEPYEIGQADNPNVISIDYIINPFDAENDKRGRESCF